MNEYSGKENLSAKHKAIVKNSKFEYSLLTRQTTLIDATYLFEHGWKVSTYCFNSRILRCKIFFYNLLGNIKNI